VGKHPGRTEAESMTLAGYVVRDVVPWEGASGGGKAVACPGPQACSASMKFTGAPGWYTAAVQYFDQPNGASKFRLLVADQVIEEWTAAKQRVPARGMDSSSSTRRTVRGIALRPGDTVRVEGVRDGGETAGLDYIEIIPEPDRERVK
jgi:alpha-glucuronidase